MENLEEGGSPELIQKSGQDEIVKISLDAQNREKRKRRESMNFMTAGSKSSGRL